MSTTVPATSPSVQPTPERLAVWRRFLEAHAAVIELLERELAAEQRLPLSWYDVLLHLRHAPEGRLRMQGLADAVLLSKSGLTRLVDRMEQAGLVQRVACESDRRGTFAAITAEGRDMLRAAAPTHLRGIKEHFTDLLEDDEVAVLTAALERIATAARDERPEGRSPRL